jgi:hypothetical protein
MPDTMQAVTASELIVGDLVDLEGGEFFHGDPDLTGYQYGEVSEIARESQDVVAVEFADFGVAGYSPGHVFNIVSRDQLGAAWFTRFAD